MAIKIIFTLTTYEDIENTFKGIFKQPDLVINNAEDLKEFSRRVNEGESFKDKLVVLNDDINFNIKEENNFKPIGKIKTNPSFSGIQDHSNYFQGIFDGNNHTISGINIDINENGNVALFTELDLESEVRNLKLKDSIIESKKATVGSIVGHVSESKIINCYSNAELKVTKEDNSVGGIVGSTYMSEVRNCCFEGTINCDTYLATYHGSIGGVLGYNAAFSQMLNCCNKGDININILDEHPSEVKTKEGMQDIVYPALCIGGVVGTNDTGGKTNSYVINSYYTGTMSFNFKENTGNISELKVGGIAGYNRYVIENCYNAGQINNYSGYAAISDCVDDYIFVRTINCYYLDTINAPEINTIIPLENGLSSPKIDIHKLTSEEMKSKEFIKKLNEKAKEQQELKIRYGIDDWRYRIKTSRWHIDNKINDGYPILLDINYDRDLKN